MGYNYQNIAYESVQPNNVIYQYDRAFMDSKNVIIIGKKGYRFWRDMSLRIQRGEFDKIYNGYPVIINMDNNLASNNENIGAKKYSERFQVDRHRYTISLVRYKMDLEEEIDLRQIRLTLEIYKSPFLVFDIQQSGDLFNSNWMLKTDFAFRLDNEKNERFLKISTEIASKIRHATNIPIIIISYLEDIPDKVKDWSDKILLFQEGRLTDRLDLYRF